MVYKYEYESFFPGENERKQEYKKVVLIIQARICWLLILSDLIPAPKMLENLQ